MVHNVSSQNEDLPYHKKLIEVALPLEAINKGAASSH